MSTPASRRNTDWIPAAIVLGVVLVAGARLIALSVQQHSAQARESAQVVVARHARLIESQLQALADLAQRQATRAATALGPENAHGQLQSVRPDRGGFWIAADGAIVPGESDPATVQAIASEWKPTDARQPAAATRLIGVVRQGSQWLVAARTPIVLPTASGGARQVGWAIAYRELDELLSGAQLGRLPQAGYDFELSQLEPESRRSRVFIGAPMSEPVTSTIHLPAGFTHSIPGSDWSLAIGPRAGWYPASQLAAAIALLAVVGWLLAFGTHDLARSRSRLRAALSDSRRQLQAVGQHLMTEIEQRQSLQKSFDHARYHDAFTGLPNRRYFMDQLDRALREVRTRHGQRIAIILLDIDRFRLVNDTLGHTAGDELMVQSARRFEKALVAMECVLARWGGDQFAVLLFDVHTSDTAVAIARLLQDTLRAPLELRKHRLSVAASMGVTCVDSGLKRAEDVLREADIALSVAKTHESARAVAYDPAMGGDVVSLVSLEADLHVALERDELRLVFQPIVDLRECRMVGAEALLRWHHPVEGLLAPSAFLAIAEEAGLMVPITRWIIHRVCTLAGEWRRRLPQGAEFYISVNLSATMLRDAGLSDYVAGVLKETGTPARSLKFELTEVGLISNLGAAREVLDRLHGMGIQLMLDDFGTGYSSLSYLQLFPFDYVKIDRPFVSRAGSDRAHSGMMWAMVQLASSLGLKAVAETVETQAAAYALQAMGCDFGQGYFFCAPLEAEEALQCLRSHDFRPQLEQTAATTTKAKKHFPTAPPVVAPKAATASQPDDSSATLVNPMEPVAARSVDADSPTLAEPAEFVTALDVPNDSLTLAKPLKAVESTSLIEPPDEIPTLVEAVESTLVIELPDDSPTLAAPMESLEPVMANAPPDEIPTLVEAAEPTLVIELPDDSPTLARPVEPEMEEDPDEDSPTLVNPVQLLTGSGVDADSPTVTEPGELVTELDVPDDSPTLSDEPGEPAADTQYGESPAMLKRQRRR